MFGTTFGSAAIWRWDRSKMRFTCEHRDHEIIVHFHKVGGRWSKTLPDGTPTARSGLSHWTFEVDGDRSSKKYDGAPEAQDAAIVEFKRRFGVVE